MSPRPPTPELTWSPLAIDARDADDADTVLAAKGGAVVSCLTIHIPGKTLRANLYAQLHDQIHGLSLRSPDAKGRRLCGVEHVEDIGIWQAPHTGRAELRRAIQQLERRYRRPVVLLHGWQHLGPCPTDLPTTPAAPPAETGA